jgi:hypothetical protein
MPAPASSTIAPAVAPAAPPPVAKPKRRRVVRDPHFYDEFLE